MTAGHLQLRAGVCTDIGRARTVNQDSHLMLPDRGLWVVADGMGGAQGGEVASAMVIETLTEKDARTTFLRGIALIYDAEKLEASTVLARKPNSSSIIGGL